MPELIEYLTFDGDATRGQYFTPNNTLVSVPISDRGAGFYPCINVDGKGKIQKGDSFIILSAGVILPESFCFSTPVRGVGKTMLPKLKMFFVAGGKLYYPRMTASADGSLYLPFESFEAVFNSFIDVTLGQFWCIPDAAYVTGIPSNFDVYLGLDVTQSEISMVGVPANLNGTTQEVVPFIKIAHNIPMTN